MGNLRDLLKRLTELKIQDAQYANPLTLLPGNVPINNEVDRLLKKTPTYLPNKLSSTQTSGQHITLISSKETDGFKIAGKLKACLSHQLESQQTASQTTKTLWPYSKTAPLYI
jgi:hypothetical protein